VSLRKALDAAGLAATKIVAPDGNDCAGVAGAAQANATFAAAVYAYGAHYPGSQSCPAAAEAGLKFWSSEDYSMGASWHTAGCWARSLNQNFVLLNATATIAWSTIWSVYANDDYRGNGLMLAMTPWSGNYSVQAPIWTTAHWTQFVFIGWHLLAGGSSGLLPGGGSFVAARSPDGADFSLMCVRCTPNPTTRTARTATRTPTPTAARPKRGP